MLLFMLLVLVVLSCARLPANIGKSREVVVISREPNPPLLVNNLQRYNYVPQQENLFSFIYAADTVIKDYNKFHTILLYGSLQDTFITTLLSPEAQEATQRDTFTLYKLNDVWTQGQLVIVMVVSDSHYIPAGMTKYGSLISNILEESYYQRVKENYYIQGIDGKIKNELKRFGVTFDVHKGWLIDSTHHDENFIYVHAHFPDRSIFFYKERLDTTLTDSFVINKRDALTQKYYNGDYILKDLTTAEKIELRGMQGYRLRGVWQNDSLVAGGPFLSYFLTSRDTLFVVDGMLFLPGERKTEQFTKIEVLLNSFQLISP
jgi:hypothetical protein